MNHEAPRGRLKAKRRPFPHIVRDIRHVVFSVIRHRKVGDRASASPLGSGFFVSPTVFLTCNHVINSRAAPHLDGDTYHLVQKLTGKSGGFHEIRNVKLGKNLHLFPADDLALLVSTARRDQPYVALDYGECAEGLEIGVAGYPLAKLGVVGGRLTYDGLIFRVARGTVTATYDTNVSSSDQAETLPMVPVIEVNFLFVPGNSGGPIFDAETGRVLGFVHGYSTEKIRERLQEATLIQDIPEGVSKVYIENLNALYSLGIKMNRVRSHIEKLGVSL